MDVKQLTQAEVSVLAGRISHPRVPPKGKEEAKAHLKLIEAHRKYERQLMEKEAGQQRSKRDNLEFAMKEWEEILPDFEERRWGLKCANIWRHYPLPAPYRGNIWKRVLGNPGGVTEEGYRCWLQKAKDRQHHTTGGGGGAGGGDAVPIDEAMRRLLDEDPNYFSPRSGKDESANLIAVDLPRTIITRTGANGHRRVDSTMTNSSTSGSPRVMSPIRTSCGAGGGGGSVQGDRRSLDGASSSASTSPMTSSNSGPPSTGPGFDASPVPYSSEGSGGGDGRISGQAAASSGGSQNIGTSGNVDLAFFANLSFGHQQGQSTCHANSFSTTTLVEAMGQDGGNLMVRLETCLRCFVEHRPDMGYVQGMSYLASMLLMNLSDRDAFIALSSLLTKGHFPYFYTVNHQGMSAHISVFEQVVRSGAPEVARNMTVIGVVPQMYVCDWWMSMFSRTLPYEITARCWDLYLYDEAYLYRISFCLLIYFSHVIHEDAELDEVMSFLSKIQSQPINEERFFCLVNDPKLGPGLKEIRGYMEGTLGMLAPQVSHNDGHGSDNGVSVSSTSSTTSNAGGGLASPATPGLTGASGRVSSSRSLDGGVTTNHEP